MKIKNNHLIFYDILLIKKILLLLNIMARLSDHWGQGLMPEAVSKVIEYLFLETKLDVIFCRHSLCNLQSARVQEKCGFRHYSYRKYETGLGIVEDKGVNILTREEYVK